jgi:hypothetical protein
MPETHDWNHWVDERPRLRRRFVLTVGTSQLLLTLFYRQEVISHLVEDGSQAAFVELGGLFLRHLAVAFGLAYVGWLLFRWIKEWQFKRG